MGASLNCCWQNAGAQAALQVADKLIGSQEENRTVLRIIIDNMLYPITVEVLKTVRKFI